LPHIGPWLPVTDPVLSLVVGSPELPGSLVALADAVTTSLSDTSLPLVTSFAVASPSLLAGPPVLAAPPLLLDPPVDSIPTG